MIGSGFYLKKNWSSSSSSLNAWIKALRLLALLVLMLPLCWELPILLISPSCLWLTSAPSLPLVGPLVRISGMGLLSFMLDSLLPVSLFSLPPLLLRILLPLPLWVMWWRGAPSPSARLLETIVSLLRAVCSDGHDICNPALLEPRSLVTWVSSGVSMDLPVCMLMCESVCMWGWTLLVAMVRCRVEGGGLERKSGLIEWVCDVLIWDKRKSQINAYSDKSEVHASCKCTHMFFSFLNTQATRNGSPFNILLGFAIH